jgi:leader peptidase (prepilin peptidase)/N-methyltransferase
VNTLLVAGCAAGGAIVGVVLDAVVSRIPGPAVMPEPADATRALAVRSEAPPAALERLATGGVTAILLGAAAARLGPAPDLAAYCVLFAGLVAVSVADIRVGLVPRKVLYPTLVLMTVALTAAAAVAGDWRPLADAAAGGAVAFFAFFAVWWLSPRAMGFGDVRLAGVVGAGLGWLGFYQVYLGFLTAFVVGAGIGLVKMAVQGTGRKTVLPFGPALAVGAVVGVLWGGYLANLWFHPSG